MGEDRFIDYYHDELGYLRQGGLFFAKKHPKIAKKLGINASEATDPQTERIIESFAYLAARINQNIENRLPEVSTALLELLYPYLVRPIPSMAISQFKIDATKGKLNSGHQIASQTKLFAYADKDIACQFQTIYPSVLWPIEVVLAEIMPGEKSPLQLGQWYLKMTLKAKGNYSLSDISCNNLRFYIHNDKITSFALYQGLFSQVYKKTFVFYDDNYVENTQKAGIKEVGFRLEEDMITSSARGQHAFQLIQDYFNFPEKFLFFDLFGFDTLKAKDHIDIYIPISDHHMLMGTQVNADTFQLGCTPIVNLFSKVSDPIRLNYRKDEYLLLADQRRDRTTEIHSINHVFAVENQKKEPTEIAPYFNLKKHYQSDQSLYWHAKRKPSLKNGMQGTDIFLRFVDMKFNPQTVVDKTIYAECLCTNRYLAEQVPAFATLQMEERIPITKIQTLTKLSSPNYSSIDGETLWRLVKQLATHYLGITNKDDCLDILQNNLSALRGGNMDERDLDISSIVDIRISDCVSRLGNEAWRGYVSGKKIELTADENIHKGGSSFLLTSVLRHYFSLNTSINSFTKVSLYSHQRQGVWMEWEPVPGKLQTL